MNILRSKIILVYLSLFFTTISSMQLGDLEAPLTPQHSSIQAGNPDAYALSTILANHRWGTSNYVAGFLMGGGTVLALLTYIHSSQNSEVTTIIQGGTACLTFSGGVVWWGITRCCRNVGAEIRSLVYPFLSED